MPRSFAPSRRIGLALTAFAVLTAAPPMTAHAQQKVDEEYTRLIRQFMRDPRIATELVNYLPASDKVPSPLKGLGHIIGAWGILDKSDDFNRYLSSIAAAAPTRAKYWTIGKSEEGRDMSVILISNEETIRHLDRYKRDLASLTDPRKTTDEQAKKIIQAGKPIYWMVSGMHSPERGGPESLMELAYRLVVDESPFVQTIRNNVIVMITPVAETDGRDKDVDTYNFNKDRRNTTEPTLPLMYWGKYVQHDNNRDGMGQFLALTRNLQKVGLEWNPTILHDLHEAATLLYASTGTGPYNEHLDAITTHEWWLLAENDVMEMTKRNVPGVWTYGFYDGWTPNYMFFMAHGHNATGRFYEVQSYGPDTSTVRSSQSREWFRPNPAPTAIAWGPRENANIQQSALLLALNRVGRDRDMFLENYWLKNKRSIQKGRDGPTFGWVIPAGQRRKADAADAVNTLMSQGIELHRAASDIKAGAIGVKAGDYIIRADQPFRTLADMYFALQNFAPANPSPYDDTGWTFQYLRDIIVHAITDKDFLTAQMTLVTGPVQAAGGVTGNGSTIIVEHTGDNNIVSLRFKLKDVKMQAAEADFDAEGHHFHAGAILIPNADRARIEPLLRDLGLSGWATSSAPGVKTHDLDVPRIGYAHSWRSTQDEGWVRAALDTYGIPYTYFGDKEFAKMSNIKQQYDVIIYPHNGGDPAAMVNGIAMTGTKPLPYKRSKEYPSLGYPDSTDDIRGGMGLEGLANLYNFVQEGGLLLTEGSSATLFPGYNLTPGVTIERPQGLFARGTILRGVVADAKSPIMYGIADSAMPVYFNSAPVLSTGAGGAFAGGRGGGGGAGLGQNISPMATRLKLSAFTQLGVTAEQAAAASTADALAASLTGKGGGVVPAAKAPPPAPNTTPVNPAPAARVIMKFPDTDADMLLSGTLVGGNLLTGRAQILDSQIGRGHVVMFAIRPYWRWQTQGTYILGFNALLNWNHLDAGKAEKK